VNFCDLIQKNRVATELENVRTALVGVADSFASHFGEWGAVSRFAAREPAKESTAAADAVMDRKEQMEDRVTYEQNIRQLFRDRDVPSMPLDVVTRCAYSTLLKTPPLPVE
jgi:hypothetical protein